MRNEMMKAFLSDIVEDPDDLSPWPIFADWLDENGEPDRAELVRLRTKLEGCREYKVAKPLQRRAARLEKEFRDEWKLRRPAIKGVRWGRGNRGFVYSALLDDGFRARPDDLGKLFASAPLVSLGIVVDERPRLPALRRLAECEGFARLPSLELVDPTPEAVKALFRPGRPLRLRSLAVVHSFDPFPLPVQPLVSQSLNELANASTPDLASVEVGNASLRPAEGIEGFCAWLSRLRLRRFRWAGRTFPATHRMDARHLRAILGALDRSRLEELELPHNKLRTCKDVVAAGPFPALRVLDLQGNSIPKGRLLLAADAPGLNGAEFRPARREPRTIPHRRGTPVFG